MSVRLTFEGLDEFKNALRNMPQELAGRAANIIQGQVDAADAEIRISYAQHRHTGYLAQHMRKKVTRGPVSVVAELKNTAPHAWLFENGTIIRHTDHGANRGVMPPIRVFIPTAKRHRREMYRLLKEALREEGLLVEGDAE